MPSSPFKIEFLDFSNPDYQAKHPDSLLTPSTLSRKEQTKLFSNKAKNETSRFQLPIPKKQKMFYVKKTHCHDSDQQKKGTCVSFGAIEKENNPAPKYEKSRNGKCAEEVRWKPFGDGQ